MPNYNSGNQPTKTDLPTVKNAPEQGSKNEMNKDIKQKGTDQWSKNFDLVTKKPQVETLI